MKKILPILSIFFLVSCGVQKSVLREQIKKDSLRIEQQQKEIFSKDSTIQEQKKTIEESSEETVVFQDRCDTAKLREILKDGNCNPSLIDSFFKAIGQQEQEIQILQDGSKVFKGQIKEYRLSTSKLVQENSFIKSTNQRLERENTYLKTHVKTEVKEVQRTIIRHKFPILLLLLVMIFFISTLYFYYKSKKNQL